MPTLLLSQRYSQDSNALWRAAVAAGWELCRVHGLRLPEGFAADEPVLYGETLLGDAVAAPLDLALLEPSADLLPRLPESYRRRAVRLLPLAAAQHEPGPCFIKPVDEKCFPARVYASGAALDVADLDPELPVLVAEPVRFSIEYRVFVRERQVATLSPYIREGEIARDAAGEWPAPPGEQDEAEAFARRLLADPEVALPPAVVVDVGRMIGPDGSEGWAVVEANAAWASGLCGCDPRAVLPVLQRACRRRSTLTADDACWLRGGGGGSPGLAG